MKAASFNVILSVVLLTLAAMNLVFGAWDRSLHASSPMCGGVPAPGASCVCCEDSGTWYCGE